MANAAEYTRAGMALVPIPKGKKRPVTTGWNRRENVVTDNGNQILDVHGLRILDPPALENTINNIAGVVTVGLFAHRPADVVIVGAAAGTVRKLGP